MEVAMNSKIKVISALVVVVFIPLALQAAEDVIVSQPPDYRGNDTLEDMALLTSFALIDYSQSVDMFFNRTGYHEMNPVLGPNPSRQDLFLFGTIGLCLSYVLTEIVPDTWRQIVIDSIVASEKHNIEDNRLLYQGWNTEGPPLRGRTVDGIPIIVSVRF
jgi:hypothetical protein